MKKTVELFIAALIIVNIIGCKTSSGSSRQTTKPPALPQEELSKNDSGLFQEPNHNISFRYPIAWRLDQNQPDVIVSIINPSNNNNVNLSINKLPKPIPKKTIVQSSVRQLKNRIPNFNNLKVKEYLTDQQLPVTILSFQGDLKNTELEWRQFLFFKKQNLYVLTYTGSTKTFSDNLPQAYGLVNSFKY
ncbi:hypothetical protein GF322_00625 [Candidatus Dependentiae bacterium]|nr:hypothetical protein [Candidatus Dependentiae bacterium]